MSLLGCPNVFVHVCGKGFRGRQLRRFEDPRMRISAKAVVGVCVSLHAYGMPWLQAGCKGESFRNSFLRLSRSRLQLTIVLGSSTCIEKAPLTRLVPRIAIQGYQLCDMRFRPARFRSVLPMKQPVAIK